MTYTTPLCVALCCVVLCRAVPTCYVSVAGALVGAAHGSGWLPQHWLSQLETDAQGVAFFGRAAAEAEAAADDAGEDGGAQRVLTTCNMGKDGAVELARLLAELDCKEL